MTEQMKAAIFICRAHGANPLALRTLLKDPRVGHTEILASCCSPEGRDHIHLFLMGKTAEALLIVGCLKGLQDRYQELARTAGLSTSRVAVVPAAACRSVNAAELALARVLDPREPRLPSERKERSILVVGDGKTAEAALAQAEREGMVVRSVSPNELLETGVKLLGGPGRFVLEVGESILEFGAALLISDHEVVVEAEQLCDRPGRMVVLAGGEECRQAFIEELEKGLADTGKVYAVAQETPFTGLLEITYSELQGRGVTFLRASEVEVDTEGVRLRDEHLGEELSLPVGTLVTVSSSRPVSADPVLRLFGLPSGWRARGLQPGESGMPGIYLGGSALTGLSGGEEERAVRATIIGMIAELSIQAERVPLAKVDREKCSLCLTCLRLCPYRAPFIEEEAVAISSERCRGCGLCLSMCPSQAIEMPPTDLRGEIGGTNMGQGGA